MPSNPVPPEGYTLRYDNQTGEPIFLKSEQAPEDIPAESSPCAAPVYASAPVAAMPCLYPDCVCAGFIRRLAAFAIDAIIVGVIIGFFSLIVWLAGIGNLGFFSSRIFFSFTAADIVKYLFITAYFIVLTKCAGATLGKRVLRLRVASSTEAPLSWWRIIYRETVGRYLSSILFIGYLVLAADKQHRGFHDMLADTRVVFDN